MFLQTHLAIAHSVSQAVNQHLEQQLSPWAFSMGSVYPDLSHEYKSVRHRKAESYELLNSIVTDLLSSSSSRDQRRQSFQLGIISHFLCDYFCQAHNYTEYFGTLKHPRYELQLDRERHKLDLNAFCEEILGENRQLSISTYCFDAYISDLYGSYMQERRDPMGDLSFAVRATTTVVAAILGTNGTDFFIPNS